VDITGKTVFITGSSIGIGRATAYEFAKIGAKLILTYRTNREEAQDTVEKCRDLGSNDVLLLNLDVRDSESVKKAVEDIRQHFGEIDILINNAGIFFHRSFKDYTLDEIEDISRTDFEGLIKVTSACFPIIKEMIINISSQVGTKAYGEAAVYAAAKWGVRGFTKSLAQDCPHLKVYSVNPGATATQMTDFEGVDPSEVGEIIVKLVKGEYNLPSGSDVNVFEMV
jgi:3-oxoacyl-[acyl-carrier protein] reductase